MSLADASIPLYNPFVECFVRFFRFFAKLQHERNGNFTASHVIQRMRWIFLQISFDFSCKAEIEKNVDFPAKSMTLLCIVELFTQISSTSFRIHVHDHDPWTCDPWYFSHISSLGLCLCMRERWTSRSEMKKMNSTCWMYSVANRSSFVRDKVKFEILTLIAARIDFIELKSFTYSSISLKSNWNSPRYIE